MSINKDILDSTPAKIIPFPSLDERRARERQERFPQASYRRTAPKLMEFEEARAWFEKEMDSSRTGMPEQERQEILEREKLYTERGLYFVEGKGLLGVWQAGHSPVRDASLHGARDMSKVEDTQYYHLKSRNGSYIVFSLTRRKDGRMDLKENLYRRR